MTIMINSGPKRRYGWCLLLAAMAGCAGGPTVVGGASDPVSVAAPTPQSDEDANAAIAASVPSTDIVLVQLAAVLAGAAPSTVTAIVTRRGYDNQPAFDLDGGAVLFSSIRDDQQSDVFRYVIATGETTQVTHTPQSEYSPTPLVGGGFSCVQVALDGTQRLWRYDRDGTPVAAVRPDITGVGYHAWLAHDLLALFIVDEPLRLELASVAGGVPRVVATNIGRALHRTSSGTLAYVRKDDDGVGTVHELDPATGRDRARAALPAGGEDLVWLADGSALTADGRKLYRLMPGADQWHETVDLAQRIGGDITRMAVDPAGQWLALVVAESVD